MLFLRPFDVASLATEDAPGSIASPTGSRPTWPSIALLVRQCRPICWPASAGLPQPGLHQQHGQLAPRQCPRAHGAILRGPAGAMGLGQCDRLASRLLGIHDLRLLRRTRAGARPSASLAGPARTLQGLLGRRGRRDRKPALLRRGFGAVAGRSRSACNPSLASRSRRSGPCSRRSDAAPRLRQQR